MDDERMEVTICGRNLGTANGWDGEPEFFWFYDFQPIQGVALPACESLYVDYGRGWIGTNCSPNDSMITDAQDLPTFLLTVARTETCPNA